MSKNKKWKRVLLGRAVLVALMLLIQLGVIALIILKAIRYSTLFYAGFILLSTLMVLYVVNKKENPNYQLVWVTQILLFPIFGGLFYMLFNFQSSTRKMRKALDKLNSNTSSLRQQDEAVLRRLAGEGTGCTNQANYLLGAGFPVYEGTTAEYLPSGEVKFARLQQELAKAEHFIFLEYFIIGQGVMWDAILEILTEKARAGVEVRVIFDGMGSLLTLPGGYDKELEARGIRCIVFNPFRPMLSTIQNNRDHRKIVVIDGHTAFTGGINLADEYINVIDLHGHWKDASILVRGEAVWSFTVMFLEMWNLHRPGDSDFSAYASHAFHPGPFAGDGYLQPYADSPIDDERVGELVYLGLIGNARDYVYICTPYLIIDYDMVTALSLAAKSGVDVRIITPYRADKKVIHMTTRSYYGELLQAGVKIYEYSPGFIHAKTFVSDDHTATVGTINLDYRSLYLHFECGLWMHKNQEVLRVKEDFLKTQQVCQPITLASCNKYGFFTRLAQKLLQLFAPLL